MRRALSPNIRYALALMSAYQRLKKEGFTITFIAPAALA